MSIQTIPLATLKKIRQYIQRLLVVPESENRPQSVVSLEEVDELPEPESIDQLGDLFNVASSLELDIPISNTQGRWFVSAVNPGATLIKLPALQLKEGWRLVSYLYRLEDRGLGVTWAVPEQMSAIADLENALAGTVDDSTLPHPTGALGDFMEAIEGDRTIQSFAIASILRREIQEFGRLGKYCNWSHHRLIDAIPTQVKWQWNTQTPKSLGAKVQVLADSNKVGVEFFTLRASSPIAIYRHVDVYADRAYNAKCVDKPMAIPLRKKTS